MSSKIDSLEGFEVESIERPLSKYGNENWEFWLVTKEGQTGAGLLFGPDKTVSIPYNPAYVGISAVDSLRQSQLWLIEQSGVLGRLIVEVDSVGACDTVAYAQIPVGLEVLFVVTDELLLLEEKEGSSVNSYSIFDIKSCKVHDINIPVPTSGKRGDSYGPWDFHAVQRGPHGSFVISFQRSREIPWHGENQQMLRFDEFATFWFPAGALDEPVYNLLACAHY